MAGELAVPASHEIVRPSYERRDSGAPVDMTQFLVGNRLVNASHRV